MLAERERSKDAPINVVVASFLLERTMRQREIRCDGSVSPLHPCSTLNLMPRLMLGFRFISPVSAVSVAASYARLVELYPRAQNLFRQTDAIRQRRKLPVGQGWDNRPRRTLPFAQPRLPHASAWWQVTQRRSRFLRRAIRKRAPLNFARNFGRTMASLTFPPP